MESSRVRFHKYTANGNNFVLLDEIEDVRETEEAKSAFAAFATDKNFAIGCDNLLVVQRFSPEILREINESRRYWSSKEVQEILNRPVPDFVFRMFEPDGTEALCCGNGLLCVAHHLKNHYGIREASILTEVPASRPVVRRLRADGPFAEVDMGRIEPLPPGYVRGANGCGAQLLRIDEVRLSFGTNILGENEESALIGISGYVIHTGEPHLVLFDILPEGPRGLRQARPLAVNRDWAPGRGTAPKSLTQADLVARVLSGSAASGEDSSVYPRSSLLFYFFAKSLIREFRPMFPHGINVNLARVKDPEMAIVEYRCFERGIERETLACGTGAVAVAAAACILGLVQSDAVTVLPALGRSYNADARLYVWRDEGANWYLKGRAHHVFDGYTFLDGRRSCRDTCLPCAMPLASPFSVPCR